MAVVKPFKGVRPPKSLVEKVQSRPYDVLNSAEARAEAGDNEMSLYHIIRPEIDFPVGTDEHEPQVYAKAAENFAKFQKEGWLVQDDKELYYIYAQTMNGKTQYGLVVCAYVDDYMNGAMEPLRRLMYRYHRLGLDAMFKNADAGRKMVTSCINLLKEAYDNRPLAYLTKLFTEYKQEEIVNIYSNKGGVDEKKAVVKILSEINPSQMDAWDKIEKSAL